MCPVTAFSVACRSIQEKSSSSNFFQITLNVGAEANLNEDLVLFSLEDTYSAKCNILKVAPEPNYLPTPDH